MATLNAGSSLSVNQQLQSDNGQYTLIMQGDGNLVLYEGVAIPPWHPVWATNTGNLPPAFRPIRAQMQQDGNFVLYSITGAQWATNMWNYPGSRLVMQDDRNLVIYDSHDRPIWATGTEIAQQPAPTQPIRVQTPKQNIGWGKLMQTTATLYRNGRLQISTFTQNDHWTGGLRGRVLVVVVDAQGRAICVSEDHACATRCSVPDFSCASYGTDLFADTFPEPIGRYASRLDIYQAEVPSFVTWRQKTIDAIRAVEYVAPDLKTAITSLFG